MDNWAWVPWVIAGLGICTTAFFAWKNLRLAATVHDGTAKKQQHDRDMDWLDVARNELSAKVAAAKAETIVEITRVDARLAGLDTKVTQVQGAAAAIESGTQELREGVVQANSALRAMTDVLNELRERSEVTQKAVQVLSVALHETNEHVGRETSTAVIDLTQPSVTPTTSRGQ